QVHQRNAIVMGEVLDESALSALAAGAAEGRAAPHGEVLAPKGHRPAVDACQTCDIGSRRDGLEPVLRIVGARAGERSDLAEAAFVRQFRDAFPDGQPAVAMLALD